MGLKILNNGLLSTIQDGGRYGYQHKGLSPAGAMDQRSLRIANILLGNDELLPCIEISYIGISMVFHESVNIAITGAEFPIMINGRKAQMNKTLHIIPGDIVEIGAAKKGVYAYIAFSKALIIDNILGSSSTDCSAGIGGFKGRKLEKGDLLNFKAARGSINVDRQANRSITTTIETECLIRFVEGCEYHRYNKENQMKFEDECFRISEMSDRMGYRLTDNAIHALDGNDILSEGLTIGTIQGTSNGDIIVMMADRQPTGGYTRIANIIAVDIPKFAQLKAASKVTFEKVSLEKAHALLRAEEEAFQNWKRGLDKLESHTVIDEKLMHINVNGHVFNIKIEEVE